jgi:hypothetical protein
MRNRSGLWVICVTSLIGAIIGGVVFAPLVNGVGDPFGRSIGAGLGGTAGLLVGFSILSHALAHVSIAMALVCYGTLAAWLIRLAYVGGLSQLPQTLHDRTWEAAVFAVVMGGAGTLFLLIATVVLGRNPRAKTGRDSSIIEEG